MNKRIKKFNWARGWVWACPRIQRLAYWAGIQAMNALGEFIATINFNKFNKK